MLNLKNRCKSKFNIEFERDRITFNLFFIMAKIEDMSLITVT